MQSKIVAITNDIETNGTNKYFYIGKIDDRIIGCISHGPCGPEISECSKGVYDHYREIGSVFVRPEYQGQGIGSLLLNTMFLTMKAKGYTEFVLDSGYPSAQKIWSQKFGPPSIIAKDYWDESYDHMVWFKTFEDITISFQV